MALTLSISGRTKPGRRDELFAAFQRQLADRALGNDAQRVVVWSADLTDADAFQLFEIYSDAQAAAANAQADWFAAYLTDTMPLLEDAPTMSQGTPLWTKGVALLTS